MNLLLTRRSLTSMPNRRASKATGPTCSRGTGFGVLLCLSPSEGSGLAACFTSTLLLNLTQLRLPLQQGATVGGSGADDDLSPSLSSEHFRVTNREGP